VPRIQREDPTLAASVDPDTGQTLLSGMGELHLEVTLNRLEREFGVRVASGKPRVSFRETVRGTGTGTPSTGARWRGSSSSPASR
jgi:elongation factor G